MFSKDERQIFRYFNGTKNVKVDPQAVQRRMMAFNLDCQTDLKKVALVDSAVAKLASDEPSPLAKQTVQEGLEAAERLIQTARKAFNVPEYQGDDDKESGLTDKEVFELCLRFKMFNDELKKNIEQQPTLLTSADSVVLDSDPSE